MKTTIYISKETREELKIMVAKKRMKDYEKLMKYLIKLDKKKDSTSQA